MRVLCPWFFAPAGDTDAIEISSAEGPVKICVDPYVQPERQKQIFGEDLGSAGIIPIRVVMENAREGRYVVKSSGIALVLPDSTRINQTGARAASAKMPSSVRRVAVGNAARPADCFLLAGL